MHARHASRVDREQADKVVKNEAGQVYEAPNKGKPDLLIELYPQLFRALHHGSIQTTNESSLSAAFAFTSQHPSVGKYKPVA
jgi:hypothetical protein